MKKKINVDVLEHHLVPRMKVIGEKDKEKLLKKYNLSEKDLPIMFSDDPASKALDAKAGQVIEVKREDPTGSNIYYRLVV